MKIVELTVEQKAIVKRLAERALQTRTTQVEDVNLAVSEDGARYIMATIPATTLGLLAEIERLTGEAAAERAAVVAWLRKQAAEDLAKSRTTFAVWRLYAVAEKAAADAIEAGEHVPSPVPPEVPAAPVASEGADGLGSAPSTLADLYDDVPDNIADGDR